MNTTDLTKFDDRERKIFENLLHAWNEDGLPDDFINDETTIVMNEAREVFITNYRGQIAMINDDLLELYYNDPETGERGFREDLSQTALDNLGLLEEETYIQFELDYDDEDDD